MKTYKYKNITIKAYNKEDARRKLIKLKIFIPLSKLPSIKKISNKHPKTTRLLKNNPKPIYNIKGGLDETN